MSATAAIEEAWTTHSASLHSSPGRQLYTLWDSPPDELRLALQAWLTDHGIDPTEAHIPGWIERRVVDQQVAVLMYASWHNGGGRYWVHGDDETNEIDLVATCVHVVTLDRPPAPFPSEVDQCRVWTQTIDPQDRIREQAGAIARSRIITDFDE